DRPAAQHRRSPRNRETGASGGGQNRAEQHPIPIHPSGSPSPPRAIQNKLLIAISESRKSRRKLSTLSGECGIGRLAKVHEHCSCTIRTRFLPSEAGPLLAAPASSWRTTCHSITSSARASSVGGTSRPSALAVFRLITSSYLVGACTGRSA